MSARGPARSAVAFAPASIGNVAAGFDVLGLAVAGAGDRVTAERVDAPGISITGISGDEIGCDAGALSRDPASNTAAIAASAVWQRAGERDGLALSLHKGTPLGSGMGSSAASAVAGAVAANALLASPLGTDELLEAALAGEAFASGARHADNVAPSLLGGLVLCPPHSLPRCERLRLPDGLLSVLVHPHMRIDTASARAVLADDVPLVSAVMQAGLLAQVIQACARNDRELLKVGLRDVLVEHQRSAAVTAFDAVRDAALAHGALGVSLSGSGPSLFAIADEAKAERTGAAMRAAFADAGVAADVWVSPGHAPGARVESRQ